MRKGGGGWGVKRCHPCLNFVMLRGGGDTLTVVITWIMLLTCLIVAVGSHCCSYGMSFFDLKTKKKWLFIRLTFTVITTKINYLFIVQLMCLWTLVIIKKKRALLWLIFAVSSTWLYCLWHNEQHIWRTLQPARCLQNCPHDYWRKTDKIWNRQ